MKMNPFLWTFANKYELTTSKCLWFSLIYARIDRLCRRLYTVIQDAVWATFFRENNQECSWGDVCYSVISSHTHTHRCYQIALFLYLAKPNNRLLLHTGWLNMVQRFFHIYFHFVFTISLQSMRVWAALCCTVIQRLCVYHILIEL